MKFLTLLLLAVSILITSCSSPYIHWDRSIANEIEPPLNAEELFSIKSTANRIKNSGNSPMNFKYMVYDAIGGIDGEYIVDPEMPSDIAYRIEPTIENMKYKIKIYASVGAIDDESAFYELESILSKFKKETFLTKYSLFELYYNAKLMDFPSLQVMAKLRELSIVNNDGEGASRAAYWADINEKFNVQEKIFNKKKKLKTEERKSVMDVLDKVSEDKQFKNLVAKNDRKGATKLLKSYLPWEEMPPFERKFWETNLEVMANPVPVEERVLIYRGLEDDVLQIAQDNGKVLTREEAIKEQKIFLLSTMMTKNQGSWNRRLRSLTAMYEKHMGTDEKGSSKFTRATRITNMFLKHSMDPVGSPFLSYTADLHIANKFGQKRKAAYFLDPRLLYFNMTSGYAHEIEFLLPLVSFPDDLASLYDYDTHGINGFKFLKTQAILNLDERLGAGKGEAAYARIEKNSEKFFAPVIHGRGEVVPADIVGNFNEVFKQTQGIQVVDVADPIKVKSPAPASCTDIIQLFWK